MGFAIIFVIFIIVTIATLVFLCSRQCERAERERKLKLYEKEKEPWNAMKEIKDEVNMIREETRSQHADVQTDDDKIPVYDSTCNKKLSAISFKEAMVLSSRDYRIIFCIFVINIAVGFVLRMLGEANREFDIITLVAMLIAMLIAFISICVFLASPVIWVLHIRLTKKLKAMIQQLEEAIEQRDKAIMTQDLRKRKK